MTFVWYALKSSLISHALVRRGENIQKPDSEILIIAGTDELGTCAISV